MAGVRPDKNPIKVPPKLFPVCFLHFEQEPFWTFFFFNKKKKDAFRVLKINGESSISEDFIFARISQNDL